MKRDNFILFLLSIVMIGGIAYLILMFPSELRGGVAVRLNGIYVNVDEKLDMYKQKVGELEQRVKLLAEIQEFKK